MMTWLKKNQFLTPYVLIALVTAVIYASSVTFDFLLWDDPLHIIKNPFFAEPFIPSVIHLWTRAYFNLYIPLVYTVWDVVARVSLVFTGALDPHFFHALNVLTHALTACLVYALLRRLLVFMAPVTDAPESGHAAETATFSWPALAGALLFAVHPAQAAAVGWVSGFKDIGCAALSVAALLRYLRRPRSQQDLWMSLGFYVAALLVKPSAVVVPALAWFFDYGRDAGAERREPHPYRAPGIGLLIGAAFALIDKAAQPNTLLTVVTRVADRPFIALDSLRYYVFRLLDFVHASPEPGRNPQLVLAQPTHWGVLVPPLIFTGLWVYRKKLPGLWQGWVFFVLSLGPVLGFVPFGRQEVSTVAEDYLYFPVIGLCWALTWALSRWNSRATKTVTALALIFLGVTATRSIGIWKNSVTFFSAVAKENPMDSVAYNGLGAYALDHNDVAAAYENFKKAVAIKPDLMGTSNLATTLQMQGRLAEMENLLLATLQPLLEHPESYYANELAREPIVKMAVLEAYAHVQRKEWREAEYYLTVATQFGPQKSGVFFDLGQIREAQKNFEGAAQAYDAACALEPRNPVFHSKCAAR